MGRNKKLYTFDELNAQAERIDQAAKLSSVVRKEIENLHRSESLEDIIDGKDLEIMELKHQIVGYKAVISYLEHQLGLGKSQ
jgi:hypothetical protein